MMPIFVTLIGSNLSYASHKTAGDQLAHTRCSDFDKPVYTDSDELGLGDLLVSKIKTKKKLFIISIVTTVSTTGGGELPVWFHRNNSPNY